MLILAGVSLNAIIGDNGIITNAQNASIKTGIAALEEFLQGKYVELYDKSEQNSNLSKVELLQKYYRQYFFIPQDYGYGNLMYVVSPTGKAMYLIKKSGLPKEIQSSLVGGNDDGKTYQDYVELNDVYGVTKDLKVYYSSGVDSKLASLNGIELDDEELRDVFKNESGASEFYDTLKKYDANNDGTITSVEVKAVKTLTIDSGSSIASLDDLYNLSNLEKLIIDSKTLSNLDGIQNCPLLNYVYFRNSVITDYSSLSNLANRLQYLYFYNIDDDELNKVCSGIKDAAFSKLNTLIISGNVFWLDDPSSYVVTSRGDTFTKKSSKTITTLKPLANFNEITKKSIKNLMINNMNIGVNAEEDSKSCDMSYISGFTNLYLLRANFNSFTSLNGLENMSGLTYLFVRENCLGKALEEDGITQNSNSIESLMSKLNLYYLDLENNPNLKQVSYLSTNTAVRYLFLKGCNSLMSANDISSIITACTDYTLPCKFLNGEKYIWSDYYYVGNTAVEGKEKLTAAALISDLKDNSYIKKLDLSDCKTGDATTEITNDVLNAILKTMPQLQYLDLSNTNLSTLDFCEITNPSGATETAKQNDLLDKTKHAYCPILIELNIIDTYVVDISSLNNIIKKTTVFPNGRSMGTLALSKSMTKDENGKYKTINLSAIQEVVNSIPIVSNGNLAYFSPGNRLILADWDTIKLLENCTNLTRIAGYYSKYVYAPEGENLNLSNLTKLSSVILRGWFFQTILPDSVASYTSDGCDLPIIGNSQNFTKIQIEYTGSWIGTSQHWRDFFESLNNCTNIENLNIHRSSGFKTSYLKSQDGTQTLYTASNLDRFSLKGYQVGNDQIGEIDLTGLEVLTGLSDLVISTLDNVTNFNFLETMTNLTSLQLTKVHFDSTEKLSELVNLTYLDISNNDVISINGLSTLTNLQTLNLFNNEVVSLAPLNSLNNLRVLHLDKNSIIPLVDYNGNASTDNLSFLVNLNYEKNGSLRELYLSENNSLKGIIESHELLTLSWDNEDVWIASGGDE